MKIGIIGLGLIGGSLGLCLKKRGYADIVYGVDKDPICEEAAKRLGLIDEAVTEDECVEKSDIIIIAIPAGAASSTLIRVLDLFKSRDWQDKIVIDTCSTKERIVLDAKYHPCRKQYVATHPMAGTEYSGPWAAEPNLFDGRACIFVDPGESSPKALKTIEDMYAVLNMRPIYMNADSHDLHLAYVSHISHVTSFALALTVLDKEKDEKHIFDLASGGFSSTVRLAKSNPDMWVPILSENRENVLKVIDTYIDKMKEFRDAIDKFDEDAIRDLITEANRIKKIIR